jgi:addiction module RelB/DinJ family antitoxin
MATTTFSIRLDEDVKRQLDEFCDKVGISTNAAFSLFANKVVMEKRIPFEIGDSEAAHLQWMLARLKEREKQASDPDTKWRTHEEVFAKYREMYGYEV